MKTQHQKIIDVVKVMIAILGVTFMGMLLVKIGEWNAPAKVVTQNIEVIREVDSLSVKVSQLKNEILDNLRSCESNGSKESDGLVVYDSNKLPSFGLYQFQKKTVIYYYKTLYGKEINGKEAIELALDEKRARQLASDIIFTDSKGVDNWWNCKNKNGLGESVKWVNKVENN